MSSQHFHCPRPAFPHDHIDYQRRKKVSLQDPATRLLLLFLAWYACDGCPAISPAILPRWLVFVANSHGYGRVENLFDAGHFFAAAFHVQSAHFVSNSFALLWSDGRQPLSFEQIDAGLLVP